MSCVLTQQYSHGGMIASDIRPEAKRLADERAAAEAKRLADERADAGVWKGRYVPPNRRP